MLKLEIYFWSTLKENVKTFEKLTVVQFQESSGYWELFLIYRIDILKKIIL